MALSRFALIRAQNIANIIVVDAEADNAKLQDSLDAQGFTILGTSTWNTTGNIGQYIDADNQPIALPTLVSDAATIPADGATAATVTYTNLQPDAPESVTFDVNGAAQDVDLVNGVASIDVTSSTSGDTIVVTAQGLSTTIGVSDGS